MRAASIAAFGLMVAGLAGLYNNGSLFASHPAAIAIQIAAVLLMGPPGSRSPPELSRRGRSDRRGRCLDRSLCLRPASDLCRRDLFDLGGRLVTRPG